MYATIEDMRRILPSNVQISDENLGKPSPGNPIEKRSKLSPTDAIQFIKMGSSEIDSRLRNFYICPLRRIKTFETEIIENVSPGTNVRVRVWDCNNFAMGDIVRLQGTDIMELATVQEANPYDPNYIVVKSVRYSYVGDASSISIVKYPDPIPIICARFAASYAFDQLFNAEQAPAASQYGQEERKLALNALDSVLSGTVLLLGQDHTGRRFVRGSLLDAFGSPTDNFQFGREKGG